MFDAQAAKDLDRDFAKQRRALAREIKRANRDMPKHIREHGVTFDYEPKRDVLTISIGEHPTEFYTQGVDDVYFDLTVDTNQIIGFTILHFQRDFVRAKDTAPFFKEVLPLLLKYGSLSFAPDRKAASTIGANLRELVPA